MTRLVRLIVDIPEDQLAEVIPLFASRFKRMEIEEVPAKEADPPLTEERRAISRRGIVIRKTVVPASRKMLRQAAQEAEPEPIQDDPAPTAPAWIVANFLREHGPANATLITLKLQPMPKAKVLSAIREAFDLGLIERAGRAGYRICGGSGM